MSNSEINEPNLKVLITGDKGFVGSETTKFFKNKGIEVVGYDLMDGLDITDSEQLEKYIIINQPDRILHLAAIARFSDADNDPMLAHKTNVLGTMSVAKVAAKYHIPVVYASTGSVYMPIKETPPIKETFKACGNSVYGCSKLMGEKYIQQLNPYIILRYAHLYGKEKRHHGLIGGFVERINRGLSPTLYGGKQSNDFTYITDVAYANYLAITAPWDKWNNIYNVGTGEEISAEEAAKIICEVTGWKGSIDIKEGRTVDPERFVYDMTKSEIMLGFKPQYTFKQGLEEMFK